MLEKLKSRKLWAAILTNIIGIGTALAGADDTNLIIAGVAIAALGNLAYLIVEGNIDAKAATKIVADTAESINAVLEKEVQ